MPQAEIQVILMQVDVGAGGQPGALHGQDAVTRKPGNAFWPASQTYSSHVNVNIGWQPGVKSAAQALRDRITGVAHVMAPAAAAFVRKSRRRIDPSDCSTVSIDSSMLFTSSTSAPKLEKYSTVE